MKSKVYLLLYLFSTFIILKGNSQTSIDPNYIVQPKRWDPPLSSDELNTIMNCSNYERFGLTPDMSRETILSRHSDCCFSVSNDGRDSSGLLIILFIALLLILGVFWVIRYSD